MDMSMKIKLAATYAGISEAELARRFGCNSHQAFVQRLRTGKFTYEELEKIAAAVGARFECNFTFPDGTRL